MKNKNFNQKKIENFHTKRVQSFDIRTTRLGRTKVFLNTVKKTSRTTKETVGQRTVDGICREQKVLLAIFREQSFRDILWRVFRRVEMYARRVRRIILQALPDIAPRKMLYGSLMGGVMFGMISMAFMEHYFGPGVFARFQEADQPVTIPEEVSMNESETVISPQAYEGGADIFFEYFNEAADQEYEESVRSMVEGYPIEAMLPYIFEQDRLTAAFLVGIAKKESNWGKRVPVLDGQDCFNYWGYRGIRRMMGTGGHTCFNSRKDAVETVAKRLNKLIHSEKLNTPEKMIIWKCGFSCQGHSRESVKKWISDVDMYFQKLNQEE
ncbi:MAG: hypothetical protein HYV45_00210 [Candidatus Moranbacteria bacterium]|nr:hypothetical protein [Candidatus Moranbacteria bacterium]